MRHEPVEIIGSRARRGKGILDDIRHHANGMAENFAAMHAQIADSTPGGWGTVYVQFLAMSAVRSQVRGENAALVEFTVRLLRFQQHRPCPIAEQNAGCTILPIHEAREGFRADDKRMVVAARS